LRRSTFLIFLAYPLGWAIYASLTNWTGGATLVFTGVRNYVRLYHDDSFRLAVSNTLFLEIGALLIVLFLALLLAVMVDAKWVRFRGLFRTLYFLPIVTVPAVVAAIFVGLYDTDRGVINWALVGLGLGKVPWLDSPSWQKPAILGIIVWRTTGYMMMFFLAGLQGIEEELYDAAAVDGAGANQRFFHITLPLLRPIILFTSVLTTINMFQTFDEPFVLNLNSLGQPAGPGDSGLTMAYYLYRQAFLYGEFGYASSVGVAILLAIAVLVLMQSWGLGLFREA
jgi:ABC-type sugar transport system permease subunit